MLLIVQIVLSAQSSLLTLKNSDLTSGLRDLDNGSKNWGLGLGSDRTATESYAIRISQDSKEGA